MVSIDDHLEAYNESGNDYRYVFTREEVAEINAALRKKSWLDEVKELLKENES